MKLQNMKAPDKSKQFSANVLSFFVGFFSQIVVKIILKYHGLTSNKKTSSIGDDYTNKDGQWIIKYPINSCGAFQLW